LWDAHTEQPYGGGVDGWFIIIIVGFYPDGSTLQVKMAPSGRKPAPTSTPVVAPHPQHPNHKDSTYDNT
jgi:hypothetical protein